jgi:hypothetical protein
MDNCLANIVGDVDSLYVEIDNLNDPCGILFYKKYRFAYPVKVMQLFFII